MSYRVIVLAGCLVASLSAARDKPVITFKPLSSGDDERPVVTEVMVGPQGSDYAFRVSFDKLPWGEECKTRCANATLFLDTDNNKTTGLQLKEKGAAESGADLAVTIQGVREYKEGSADVLLRARVRQFSDAVSNVEDGDTVAELDHRNDPERLFVEGKTVYLLVDATSGTLPTASKMRIVYHPPDTKPLSGVTRGLLATGSSKVEIFKQGKRSR